VIRSVIRWWFSAIHSAAVRLPIRCRSEQLPPCGPLFGVSKAPRLEYTCMEWFVSKVALGWNDLFGKNEAYPVYRSSTSGCQGEWITESENRPPYIEPVDAVLSRIGVLDEFFAEKGVFSGRNIDSTIYQPFVDRFGWNQRQNLGENEENKMVPKTKRLRTSLMPKMKC